MRFKRHSNLKGDHAFLSPSYYHWINYDENKLRYRFKSVRAALEGVEDHRYAAEAIELREFQMDENSTLGMYINDCIHDRMEPELVLYYSDNCFGTADALSFRHRLLRIYDLKTGVTRTSEHQLEVYAALFCLEYSIDPFDIEIELRIYQNEECRIYTADPGTIAFIMDKIVDFDVRLNELRMEEEL
jgi:hypothetical protein